MDNKETVHKQVEPLQCTLNDVINNCADKTENQDLEKENKTIHLNSAIQSLPSTETKETILQTYERWRINAKLALEKAQLCKENLQKQRQLLEKELLDHEAALNAEIGLFLAQLQISAPSDDLDMERKLSVGNTAIENLSTLTAVIVQPRPLVSTTENAYCITTDTGEPLLKIYDKDHKFTLSGQTNDFEIDICDSLHQKVINICSNSPKVIEVKILGKLVSIVYRHTSFWKMSIDIRDAMNSPVLRLKKSLSSQYYIYNVNKRRVGMLTNMRCKNDTSGYRLKPWLIEFPKDLDVKFKAAVIASHFFIHFPFGL